MPMLILGNYEIILNRVRNITPAIVSGASIAIVLFIFGIGSTDADVEADIGLGEDVSQWSLPKAAKARLGKGGIN